VPASLLLQLRERLRARFSFLATAPAPAAPVWQAAGQRGRGNSKRILLWGGVAFVFVNALLLWAVAGGAPEIRDPDFEFKLRRLHHCLATSDSQRPLVLLMGSSRVAMGYRPELLDQSSGPLYFNYGLCFGGPILNLISLNRLLAEGIRPRAVYLEVWPPSLTMESADHLDAPALHINRMSWNDVGILARFASHPSDVYTAWFHSRLGGCYSFRFTLMKLFARPLLEPERALEVTWDDIHERGWLGQRSYRTHPDEQIYQRYLLHSRTSLAPYLQAPHFSSPARAALTEFMATCRREGIGVRLLWLPESPKFRDAYNSENLAAFTADLQTMAANGGAQLLDWRASVPEIGFVDGYHLSHAGAELFTRALHRGGPIDYATGNAPSYTRSAARD
jgi:Protein of unknown function (DUF1574)